MLQFQGCVAVICWALHVDKLLCLMSRCRGAPLHLSFLGWHMWCVCGFNTVAGQVVMCELQVLPSAARVTVKSSVALLSAIAAAGIQALLQNALPSSGPANSAASLPNMGLGLGGGGGIMAASVPVAPAKTADLLEGLFWPRLNTSLLSFILVAGWVCWQALLEGLLWLRLHTFGVYCGLLHLLTRPVNSALRWSARAAARAEPGRMSKLCPIFTMLVSRIDELSTHRGALGPSHHCDWPEILNMLCRPCSSVRSVIGTKKTLYEILAVVISLSLVSSSRESLGYLRSVPARIPSGEPNNGNKSGIQRAKKRCQKCKETLSAEDNTRETHELSHTSSCSRTAELTRQLQGLCVRIRLHKAQDLRFLLQTAHWKRSWRLIVFSPPAFAPPPSPNKSPAGESHWSL